MKTKYAFRGLQLLLVAGAFVPAIGAQGASGFPSDSPDLQSALEVWQDAHGGAWNITTEPANDYVRFLHGGSADPSFEAESDADYFELARTFLSEARGLMGVDVETLVEDRVLLLPLGQANSTDKVTVRFRQMVDGVPVRGGWINALFHVGGELLSLDNVGLPDLAGFDVQPTLGGAAAVDLALATFELETGLPATEVSEARLVIEQEALGERRFATLAWEVEVMWQRPDFEPEGYTYIIAARGMIAARGAPRVVSREASVHYLDVGGRSARTPRPAPCRTWGATRPWRTRWATCG